MNDIDKIKGHYIHKSILLPNNRCALQLKKDLLNSEADIIIIFKDCLMVEDIRINNLLIEDIANTSHIGMKYNFIAHNVNQSPKDYSQLIIFDKQKEEVISTGISKKSVINIIYKSFNISNDIYSYKTPIKEKE